MNYPAHRAGHPKILDEGDCIPLGRGILREDFIKSVVIISVVVAPGISSERDSISPGAFLNAEGVAVKEKIPNRRGPMGKLVTGVRCGTRFQRRRMVLIALAASFVFWMCGAAAALELTSA